jgi:tetratricopeptide (TPR) repeat protein
MKRVLVMQRSIGAKAATAARRLGPASGLMAALGLLLSAGGCAHTSRAGSTAALSGPVTTVEMEPLQIEAGKPGDGLIAFDAKTLFEEAGAHMDENRFSEAVASYDRLIKNFPDSGYVPPSIFNAGLSLEAQGRFADAAERYRHVLEQFPAAKVAKDASLRVGACHAELSRWPASIEALEAAARRTDLNLSERVETLSRIGLGYFEIHDHAQAERSFREAVTYYQAHQEEERIESPFFLAMAQFYRAHLSHKRFRELPLRPGQKQLSQDIEALAKQFMAANEGYVAAIRVKDAFWASAAGFHIGALYRELYDTLVKAPVPVELNELEKIFYSDLLKGQLRTLLEKAQGVLQKNVEWASRVGVKNGWVEKSSEQLEELSRLLAAIETQPVGPAAPTPTPKSEPRPEPPRPSTLPRIDARPRTVL